MGSIEAACISGFLCRLCSEMHRTVIHIYGDQGQKHGLAMKINAYLPVTITPNDPLPKTICNLCMSRVEQHHELMLKMEKHKSMFALQTSRMESIRARAARTNIQLNTNENSIEQNRSITSENTSPNLDHEVVGSSNAIENDNNTTENTRQTQLETIDCDDNNDIQIDGGDSTENASEIENSSD